MCSGVVSFGGMNMAGLEAVSANMQKQIVAKGYDLDEVELLEMRGRFDEKQPGSFTEGLFKTKQGAYFKCGEGAPKSPYELRAGLLVRAGTRLFELSEEDALKWLDEKDFLIYPLR